MCCSSKYFQHSYTNELTGYLTYFNVYNVQALVSVWKEIKLHSEHIWRNLITMVVLLIDEI